MLSLITNAAAVINKYLSKLTDIKPGGRTYDRAMHSAADEALTSSRERIHTKGIASDSSAIGQYDKTPMYVSTSRNPNPGEATGKTGKSIFTNGKAHRSRYFAGGYDEYKKATGQNTGSVNLTLTGEMRDGYHLIKTAEGYGLGWNEEEMTKRAAALEEKYGKKIWSLTEAERRALIQTVADKTDLK
jgi:hypothetical protein